jgi:hypothetical protein
MFKLIGYVLGIIVCLAVLGVFKDNPADKNTVRDSVGVMWLKKDIESCIRVKQAASNSGHWTPKHWMYKHCEWLADPTVSIEDKIASARVGR